MHVLKFGGSSVGTAKRIEVVLSIIKNRSAENKQLAIVFSAYQGITDQLIQMGRLAEKGDEGYKKLFEEIEERHIQTADHLISLKNRSHILTQIKILLNDLEEILYGVYLIGELTSKTLDYIQSFGERLSAYTLSECLKDQGVENDYIDSRDLIITDGQFGKARVLFELTENRIRERFNEKMSLYVITGFIASTVNGETTTLGRGGSDFSASIFGAALKAEEIEIWTDVDGVMTADPGKVKDTFSIGQLTYEEAMELSHFGAKVIHPPTMQPALDKELPIRILNTFNPGFDGTLITAHPEPSKYIIKGISSIDSVALLQIGGSGMVGSTGIAERIFNAMARNNINIILISQASSEHSICMAILPEAAERAEEALREELKYEIHYEMVTKIEVEKDMAIIAVVGENMRHRTGIAGRVFQTLGDHGINISAIAQGSSELNISMVISRKDEAQALNVLHQAFFYDGKKQINLFLTGTGLVGGALIDQIAALQKTGKQIQLCGVCNIDRMLINEKGISAENWQSILDEKGESSDIAKFVNDLKKSIVKNSVFVDCTSSEKVISHYQELLEADLSIVTPNKIANSSDMQFYTSLKKKSALNNPAYLYETTVGAGLPVIKTIRELLDTGDEIISIEGILSGTLSYLFNTYDGSVAFGEVVRKAREMGYTEPDPRADLSGLDVLRKLLILVRETGTSLEMKDIVLHDFLPESLPDSESVDSFLDALVDLEEHFNKIYNKANEKQGVLRYIASWRDGKAIVALETVAEDHAFYSMKGSENIIAFTTKRYLQMPLVVKGPGAGAQVTAAGVLSDILKAGKIE